VTFSHLLNEDVVGRVRVEAKELDLRQVSRLTGIDWPLAGTVTGQASAEGALRSLKLGGAVRVARGVFPLNWKGAIVRDVDASFTLEGGTVRLDKATGRHAGGEFTATGRLDLKDPREPVLEAAGIGTNASQPFQFMARGAAATPAIEAAGASPFPGNTPSPAAPPAR
jgi:hypothetical protein